MLSKSLKLVLFLIVVGFSSCSITKKYHSFGYRIESNFSKKSSHRKTKPAILASRNLVNNSIAHKVILSDELDEATAFREILDVVKTIKVNLFVSPINVNANLANPVHADESFKSIFPKNAEKNSFIKAVVCAKKKFIEKERKRPYLGLKGFLLMILGLIIFAIGAGAWSYILLGLGLLIFGVGGLVVLYSVFRPRK
jgi:hypothetical protein